MGGKPAWTDDICTHVEGFLNPGTSGSTSANTFKWILLMLTFIFLMKNNAGHQAKKKKSQI